MKFLSSHRNLIAALFGFFLMTSGAMAQEYYSYSTNNGHKLKIALTGWQMFPEGSKPQGVSGYVGEAFKSFGDVGVYGQLILSSDQLNRWSSYGILVAPKLFDENWGRLLWRNRIGFGSFEGDSQIAISTGLQFEPGSYFHIAVDLLHSTPIREGTASYPRSYGIGLGIHF